MSKSVLVKFSILLLAGKYHKVDENRAVNILKNAIDQLRLRFSFWIIFINFNRFIKECRIQESRFFAELSEMLKRDEWVCLLRL
jgi:hypothetical protein